MEIGTDATARTVINRLNIRPITRASALTAPCKGRLGADVELRRSESGKDSARLSVGVGEGEVTWCRSWPSRNLAEPALQGAVYALHSYRHTPGGSTVARILPPQNGG